ncbi:MAG: beta-ketoacyl-ACP synthase III [Cycloclasticus pugetii]|mgnify:CR=1 FL=1|jgi:3-oxoacyl-[acyl-carrier-protein] synthase III|uniref:Beta-ketoacyl-[acyl-carrier-protein] synthase III n=1 Tax=Cycloclasticus pugetii TaxID=34068 RepID=A0AB33Z326_9GAMM|nr:MULTISPECIES: beta-ketoacyl-ACP synthase III [Cycloclasticus]ATI03031.1 ketoacyl-ACP synthase III [Cycloclasticus sp. PY97N]EPD13784.1 3-oxoacyl-(acyl carrier protein) synthase III [Cycloclasticus pugetii]PHR48428.1 MAG: ketoacyl-ACP synthase III [Cycloclasticus sp.]|tara:strand:- start:1261 stop:2223 length:963 start_codon:yes stop_codon:yes gene_type:complete
MFNAKITGTGSYLPEKVVTNKDFESTLETTDEWIYSRTGIKQRHVIDEKESVSSMAEIASNNALEAAGLDASEIDLIIVATSSSDRVFPSTACILQNRLGANGGAAFDVQAACSGFIYALGIATQFIKAGGAKKALVVGSEANSRILDYSDRSSCVIFGDGAGAVVVEASEEPGILSTHMNADGQYQDLLYVNNPIKDQKQEGDQAFMTMHGNDVYKVAVKTLSRVVDETLEANNMDKSDVDWLIPHQANIRIISSVAKKLNMPMEKVVLTIENQANTSAASVPLALDQAVRDGRIKKGEIVLMEAFGGGFVWGSALVKM